MNEQLDWNSGLNTPLPQRPATSGNETNANALVLTA